MIRAFVLLIAPVILLAATAASAFGHAMGENYVWMDVASDGFSGRFEIHPRELKSKLGIDWQDHGETLKQATQATATQVQDYLKQHFLIIVDGESVPIEFLRSDVIDAGWLQYYYKTDKVDVPDRITIFNDIFLSEDDPLHRGLIILESNKIKEANYGAENAIMSFGPHNTTQELDFDNLPALLQPAEFIWQGVLHIWIGTDHILFLVSLLLMAVLVRKDKAWEYAPTFRTALWSVLKIVTIFTVAHSITLSLAALRIVSLESWIVESLIAASIMVVAANNIFPRFNESTPWIIFAFGLFHGMGFASVMGDLPFRTISLVQILLAFNVGVELGQLAIVAGIFPVIFLLRKWSLYRPVVVIGGSLLIFAMALIWLLERTELLV